MTDTLPASETNDLPPLPHGWHVVSYAILADGALAILGSLVDVSAARAASGAWQEGEPRPEQLTPFVDGTGVVGHIWTFDGISLLDGPTFPLFTLGTEFDRFPDGRWFVADVTYSADKPISRVLTANGSEVRRLRLGSGISHLQVDDAGYVWVGWFGDGAYGDRKFRPSFFGLAAFDEHGQPVVERPDGINIASCEALNVVGDTAWASTYCQDSPVLSVAAGRPSRRWANDLWLRRALAVSPPYLLAAETHIEGSDRAVLVRLGQERAETVRDWALPFKTYAAQPPKLVEGRGDVLHAIWNGQWHRWRIAAALDAASLSDP